MTLGSPRAGLLPWSHPTVSSRVRGALLMLALSGLSWGCLPGDLPTPKFDGGGHQRSGPTMPEGREPEDDTGSNESEAGAMPLGGADAGMDADTAPALKGDADVAPDAKTDRPGDADATAGDAGDGGPSRREPLRILTLGDSITQGDDGDYTWRYRLYQHLVAHGEKVDFVGPRSAPLTGTYHETGWDSDHGAIWGDTLAREAPLVTTLVSTYLPDVLVVYLGLNDLVFSGTSPADLAATMEQLIAGARASNPKLSVVIVQISPSQSANDAQVIEYNGNLAQLAQKISTPASRVLIAPVWSAFKLSTDSLDGTHPNVRGEYVIAKTIADILWMELGIASEFGPIPLPPPPPLPTQLTLMPDTIGVGDRFSLSFTLPPDTNPGTQFRMEVHKHFAFGFELVWASAFTSAHSIAFTQPPLPQVGQYSIVVVVRDSAGQERMSDRATLTVHE